MLLRAILVCLLVLSAPFESPLRRSLSALQAVPPDYTNVPAESRPLIVEVKHRLRDLILETLGAPENAGAAPDALTARVLDRLASEGVPIEGDPEQPDEDRPYAISGVRIEHPPGRTDLLAATTTLSLTCASDTSLYLLERRGTRWQIVLALESNGYEDMSGAACSFEYAVSPRAEDGSWYVVTADVSCWCTSNWQRLRYRVLRPGPSPDAAARIFDAERTLFLGYDEPFTLEVHKGGFELRCHGAQSLDPGALVREHVLRYEVRGGSVRRVPPLATRPEDFLDEWSGLAWSEAEQWVEQGARARARRWHARMRTEAYRSLEILSVEPRADRPSATEVGLDVRKADLLFTIVERDGAYFVGGVTARRPGAR